MATMNIRNRLVRLEKLHRSHAAAVPGPSLLSAEQRARGLCNMLAFCGLAPPGLDVQATLVALDGPDAETVAEAFLQRACEQLYEPALDMEIQHHLDRLDEPSDRMVEDFARQHGLAERGAGGRT
jgi:hypothetical protein